MLSGLTTQETSEVEDPILKKMRIFEWFEFEKKIGVSYAWIEQVLRNKSTKALTQFEMSSNCKSWLKILVFVIKSENSKYKKKLLYLSDKDKHTAILIAAADNNLNAVLSLTQSPITFSSNTQILILCILARTGNEQILQTLWEHVKTAPSKSFIAVFRIAAQYAIMDIKSN